MSQGREKQYMVSFGKVDHSESLQLRQRELGRPRIRAYVHQARFSRVKLHRLLLAERTQNANPQTASRRSRRAIVDQIEPDRVAVANQAAHDNLAAVDTE